MASRLPFVGQLIIIIPARIPLIIFIATPSPLYLKLLPGVIESTEFAAHVDTTRKRSYNK